MCVCVCVCVCVYVYVCVCACVCNYVPHHKGLVLFQMMSATYIDAQANNVLFWTLHRYLQESPSSLFLNFILLHLQTGNSGLNLIWKKMEDTVWCHAVIKELIYIQYTIYIGQEQSLPDNIIQCSKVISF